MNTESCSKERLSYEQEAAQQEKRYPIREIFQEHMDFVRSRPFNEQQKKAAWCISQCKSGDVLGMNGAVCPKCGCMVLHNSSCNNRNCPCCQYPKQRKWQEERKAETIPGVPYYHVVLTLPHELNPLILNNEESLLKLLFTASAETVIELCRDKRFLGA